MCKGMLKQQIRWIGSVFLDELETEHMRAEKILADSALARGYAVDTDSTRALASAWGRAIGDERARAQQIILRCLPISSTVTHVRKKRACDLFRVHAADEGGTTTPASTAARIEQSLRGCKVALDTDGYLVTVPLAQYRDAVRSACDAAVRAVVRGPSPAPAPRRLGALRCVLRQALAPCFASSVALFFELLVYVLVLATLLRM